MNVRTALPRPILVALVGFLIVAGALFMPQDSASQHRAGMPAVVDLPPELDRVLRDYEKGWRANDEKALAGLFTTDGFILRPRHQPVRGRQQITEAYRSSGGPLHLHAFAYEVADSVGYIIGGFKTSPDQPDAGKFILALRKGDDGQWMIAADMDNGNR